jgi:hypothetical protein
MAKANGGNRPRDAEFQKLVERAAEAERRADELLRQMQELAKEVERLKARRAREQRPRPKP